MKTVLLIRKNDNKEIEKTVFDLFLEYLGVFGDVLVVTSGEVPFHEDYSRMKKFSPNVIVSMNDAALDFVTEGGGCSLNQLPARVVHFLISPEVYSRFDKDLILNLSHAVSVCEKDCEIFLKNHHNIPNVYGHSENVEEMVSGLELALKELWCI